MSEKHKDNNQINDNVEKQSNSIEQETADKKNKETKKTSTAKKSASSKKEKTTKKSSVMQSIAVTNNVFIAVFNEKGTTATANEENSINKKDKSKQDDGKLLTDDKEFFNKLLLLFKFFITLLCRFNPYIAKLDESKSDDKSNKKNLNNFFVAENQFLVHIDVLRYIGYILWDTLSNSFKNVTNGILKASEVFYLDSINPPLNGRILIDKISLDDKEELSDDYKNYIKKFNVFVGNLDQFISRYFFTVEIEGKKRQFLILKDNVDINFLKNDEIEEICEFVSQKINTQNSQFKMLIPILIILINSKVYTKDFSDELIKRKKDIFERVVASYGRIFVKPIEKYNKSFTDIKKKGLNNSHTFLSPYLKTDFIKILNYLFDIDYLNCDFEQRTWIYQEEQYCFLNGNFLYSLRHRTLKSQDLKPLEKDNKNSEYLAGEIGLSNIVKELLKLLGADNSSDSNIKMDYKNFYELYLISLEFFL